ncbi:MAG TPA: acyl-CoA dehydrogenase family protein [Solirubrobacteraceae bacterium]|nr:acyl-CoA dehydrogenase family protein [Solirubrobacteraceae bacterium]
MTEVAARDADAVVAEVRDLARTQIAPAAADLDREVRFPAEHLRALAEVGALGLLVPADQGGSAGGLSDLVHACQSLGTACASTGMVFLMHCVAAATVSGGAAVPVRGNYCPCWGAARHWGRSPSASGARALTSTHPSCGPHVTTVMSTSAAARHLSPRWARGHHARAPPK